MYRENSQVLVIQVALLSCLASAITMPADNHKQIKTPLHTHSESGVFLIKIRNLPIHPDAERRVFYKAGSCYIIRRGCSQFICSLCYWGQEQSIYNIKRTAVSISGPHTVEKHHICIHLVWSTREKRACGSLRSATVLRDRRKGWTARVGTTGSERKRESDYFCERSNMC